MARAVDHIDIADRKTLTADQRRQETMQPVEIGHRQEQFARECLQPTAGVAGAVAQDRIAHAVGDPRLHFLEAGILASDPLAGHEADAAAAAFDRRHQIRRKAGLFCPSPSSVATMAPCAARTPLRTAADCPVETACRSCRRWPYCFVSAVSRSAVASVEPSLT